MASVVLGDPAKINIVNVTIEDRFIQLHERRLDVLIFGGTYSLEREVVEVSL